MQQRFDPGGWWPAASPWEVAVGAVLTQAVRWDGARAAVAALKAHDCLSPAALAQAEPAALQEWLRPARYPRQKARKLVALAQATLAAGGWPALVGGPLAAARARLLAIFGIGPETADSILLYAAGRPSLVVDRYTHRIFTRMGWYPEARYRYEALRSWLMDRVPPDVERYRRFHALVVELGKSHCQSRPRCRGCPVATRCREGRQAARGGTDDGQT